MAEGGLKVALLLAKMLKLSSALRCVLCGQESPPHTGQSARRLMGMRWKVMPAVSK